MAKYKVLDRSFVDNHLREPGEVIEYELPEGTTTGDNLELVVDEAPAPAEPAKAGGK